MVNLIVMSSEVETSRCETTSSRHEILIRLCPFARLRLPVHVAASPAAPFATSLRSAGNASVVKSKETPPVSQRGPLSNCPNYRVIVMQQAPGQQAPPPQQPASLDEIVVALVSVIIAAIKSRYFMILSCWNFVNPRLHELARSARAFCAEPNAVGENQIRGGGVGGRSIRADAVASSIAKVWPLKCGVDNLSEAGQKRISVAHETVQQLRGCDSCPHRS